MRRRELVLAAGGALLVRPARAFAQGGDAAILERLIAREDSAAHAHRIADATLRYAVTPAVSGLDVHEAEHAKALRTHLAALGREAPASPPLDEPARRVVEAAEISGSTDELVAAVLDAAIALEARLLAAYADATVALVEPSILRTAATIMASHAQHHALLRREAGMDPLK